MAFHEVQWYDRNPESIADQYSLWGLPPHGMKERWSYTVPPDRMAMVELLQTSVRRYTAAAPAATVQASIYFKPKDKGEEKILEAFIVSNTIGDKDDKCIGTTLTMFEGDRIRGTTADPSTGGSCCYQLSIKLTEFDSYLYHATPVTRPEPLVNVQEPGPKPDPVM